MTDHPPREQTAGEAACHCGHKRVCHVDVNDEQVCSHCDCQAFRWTKRPDFAAEAGTTGRSAVELATPGQPISTGGAHPAANAQTAGELRRETHAYITDIRSIAAKVFGITYKTEEADRAIDALADRLEAESAVRVKAEREISRLPACLNNVSGALVDSGNPVPFDEGQYGEAVRVIIKQRDAEGR